MAPFQGFWKHTASKRRASPCVCWYCPFRA